MYWSNYHSHSTFCDGRSSMEEFVKFAIAKGLKKYGFSSHAPLPFDTHWNMKLDDFADYQAEFYRLREKYASDIELYIGLEIDYINNFFKARNDLYATSHFDYLIGSIHFMDQLPNGKYWCVDGPFDDFNAGLQTLFSGDIRQATERFFEISKLMIRNDGFNIVGHVDKIALNGVGYAGFDITAAWYKNQMGEVLQLIKDKGLILEINTKSLTDKGITYPDMQFFPLINELQIPVVVNSDCHYPTKIIDGFEPTFKMLKQAGLNTMYQLINGSWQAVEFNEKGLIA